MIYPRVSFTFCHQKNLSRWYFSSSRNFKISKLLSCINKISIKFFTICFLVKIKWSLLRFVKCRIRILSIWRIIQIMDEIMVFLFIIDLMDVMDKWESFDIFFSFFFLVTIFEEFLNSFLDTLQTLSFSFLFHFNELS